MSAADESKATGEVDEGRALADLAHALARTARRGQALGRRARGPRAKTAADAPVRPASDAVREALPKTPAGRPAIAVTKTPTESRPTGRSDERPGTPAERPAASAAAGRAPAQSARDVKLQAAAASSLSELRARVAVCEACSLCKTRTQTVFMDGSADRGVLFVGEAPGADEDRTGVPFVGRSGQLLTDIITKGMGIPRAEVAIANVLKCRPPDNREPTPAEKEICTPWLDRQIELLDPRVIIPLGRHAAMHVLRVEASMGEMRQKVHQVGGRTVVPTFHPSYLLRSPGQKKECWKDIQLAMGVLGIQKPAEANPAPGKVE